MEIYDENLAIFLEKLVYEHREYSSDVQPVDSVSTVNLEALPVLSSNLTPSDSMIVERGESESSNSAVELYLEHQKNIVNASGWNEYIIGITYPNEEDIHKTIYLEGTRRDIIGTLRAAGYVIRTSMVKQLRPWRICRCTQGIPFRLRCLCSLRQRARGNSISLR